MGAFRLGFASRRVITDTGSPSGSSSLFTTGYRVLVAILGISDSLGDSVAF